MKKQTYYNTPLETMADVCDMTRELCINCVGAVDDSEEIRTRSVRRDYYLMYILEGSMNIEFDETKAVIAAGNLLIMEPGTRYLYYAQKHSGINYVWMHFTGKDAKKIVKSFGVPLNTICSCGQIGTLTELWKRAFDEFVLNDEHFSEMTSCLFTEIMTCFSRHLNKSGEKKRLIKSIIYIHQNYQKQLNTAYLASLENLSESHYRAVFSKLTGESPVEYIASRRIEAAMELLENTDKKLAEIASLVGYSDVYYFGKIFKRKTGVSPGRYRRNRQI